MPRITLEIKIQKSESWRVAGNEGEGERDEDVFDVGRMENALVLVNIHVFCSRSTLVLVEALLRRESNTFVRIIT